VEKDRNDYNRYLKAADERKRWQSHMLGQQYNNDISLKHQIKEKEKFIDREQGKLS